MRPHHALLVVGLGALALAGAPPAAALGAAAAWALGAAIRPLRALPWGAVALLGIALEVAWSFNEGPRGFALCALVPMAAFAARPQRTTAGVVALMLLASATKVPALPFAVASTVAVALIAATLSEAVGADLGVRARPSPWVALVPVLAIPAFLLAPRAPAAPAFVGFSTDVALGDVPSLREDPRVVLAVASEVEPPRSFYLRGATFEAFDGRRWTTERAAVPAAAPSGSEPRARTFVITSEPVDQGVVFTAGRTVGLHPDGAVRVDPAGSWFLASGARAARWTLIAAPPFGPGATGPGRTPDVHDLELPRMADGVIERAHALAAGRTHDRAIVDAIVADLRAHHPYSLDPADTDAADPLADFLIERRAGHCEYFASAVAVLARLDGVPARVVTGFAGGEWDAAQKTLFVRASDAHAWAEVWVDGEWLLVDATPGRAVVPRREPTPKEAAAGAFRDWFVEFDRARQREALGVLAPVALLGLGGIGVLAALRLARRAAPSLAAVDPVTREYRRARQRLVAAGWAIPPSLPPVAAARWVIAAAGPAAAPFERLAWLHYAVRFGGADPSTHASEARDLAAACLGVPDNG